MARDLRADKIGKAEFIAYIALFLLGLGSAVALLTGFWDAYTYADSTVEIVDKTLIALTTIASFVIAYYANRQGDGKRYWYRFISLNTPIAILVLVIGFVLFLIATLVGALDPDTYGYADIGLESLLYLVSFYWLYKYMRIASGRES